MSFKTINFGKRLEHHFSSIKSRGTAIKALYDRLTELKLDMSLLRKEIEDLNTESQTCDDKELQELKHIYQQGSLDNFTIKDKEFYEGEIKKIKNFNDSLFILQETILKQIELNKQFIGKSNKIINEIKHLKRRLDNLRELNNVKTTLKEHRIYEYDVNPTEETIEVENFNWHSDEFVCTITYHTFYRALLPIPCKWNRVKQNGILNKVSTTKNRELNELVHFYQENIEIKS